MIRFVLAMLAAIVLPFVIWHIAARLRGQSGEGAPNGLLLMAGAGLGLAAMLALSVGNLLMSSDTGRYEPARMEDGEVRPGRIVPDEEPAPAETPANP